MEAAGGAPALAAFAHLLAIFARASRSAGSEPEGLTDWWAMAVSAIWEGR